METNNGEFIILQDYIGKPALLEQTAEEAVELAHACLKLARKLRGENFTPKSMQECIDDLVEECADVCLCLEQLVHYSDTFAIESLDSVIISKYERMEQRIKEVEDETNTINEHNIREYCSIEQLDYLLDCNYINVIDYSKALNAWYGMSHDDVMNHLRELAKKRGE